jgi:hypothetical protein
MVLTGCKNHELSFCDKSSLSSKKNKEYQKKVISQIDSAFIASNGNTHNLKRILESNCINDSILKVKAISSFDVTGYFIFNKKLNLNDTIIYELPDIH